MANDDYNYYDDLPPRTQRQQLFSDIADIFNNVVDIDYSLREAVGRSIVELLTAGNRTARNVAYGAIAVSNAVQTADYYIGNPIFGDPDAPPPREPGEDGTEVGGDGAETFSNRGRRVRGAMLTDRQRRALKASQVVKRYVRLFQQKRQAKVLERTLKSQANGVNAWVYGK